jgi:hypothetical protein
VMEDRTDEDGAYAVRMDEWVAREAVEETETAPRGVGRFFCRDVLRFFSLSLSLLPFVSNGSA